MADYSEGERTPAERLAIMETKMDNIDRSVTQLVAEVKGWQTNYITRTELVTMLEFRDREIKELKEGNTWLRRQLFSSVLGGIVSLIGAIILLWYKA